MPSDNDVIKALLETNKELTQQILELTRLIAGIQHPQYAIPTEMMSDPLNMPETEEDANYLFRTGQIDKSELEDVLKELHFLNSEVTVPT